MKTILLIFVLNYTYLFAGAQLPAGKWDGVSTEGNMVTKMQIEFTPQPGVGYKATTYTEGGNFMNLHRQGEYKYVIRKDSIFICEAKVVQLCPDSFIVTEYKIRTPANLVNPGYTKLYLKLSWYNNQYHLDGTVMERRRKPKLIGQVNFWLPQQE
ncbi:MAG: hypothetical protein ABIT96_01355 [Ferruginibacter sp.]